MDDVIEVSADDLYRERILRASRIPAAERLLDGPRLFDYACKIAADGIRGHRSGITDAEVLEILRRRIALRERLEGVR